MATPCDSLAVPSFSASSSSIAGSGSSGSVSASSSSIAGSGSSFSAVSSCNSIAGAGAGYIAGSNSSVGLSSSSGDMRLTDLGIGTCARVVSVVQHDGKAPVELGRRLAELGFLPGEAVRIVAKGLMARAPIAVRIGTGTFALRLFEAACIRVRPEQPTA